MPSQKIDLVNANLGAKNTVHTMADAIQASITKHAVGGWVCEGISAVTASIQGSDGCFGIGATPPRTQTVCVILFRKD